MSEAGNASCREGIIKRKKQLFATTALVAAGTLALSAGAAAQGAKPSLTVNGKVEYAVGVMEGGGANDTARNDRTGIDVKSGSEIHFNASAVLDNGVRIAARVEMEGLSAAFEDDDQIDEAWIRASGAFGQILLGTTDPASRRMTFGYLGSVSTVVGHNDLLFDAPAWVDQPGGPALPLLADFASDAESVSYYTPRFKGFQAGVSYAPDRSEDDNKTQDRSGYQPWGSTAEPFTTTTIVDIIGVGANYEGRFGGVGVGAAVGYTTASWSDGVTALVNAVTDVLRLPPVELDDREAVNAGLYVDLQDVRVGVGYMERSELSGEILGGLAAAGDEFSYEVDGFDVGLRYTFGTNRAMVAYVATEDNFGGKSSAGEVAFARSLGPGVTWSLSLIWADWDGGTDETRADGYAISSGLTLSF